MQRRVEIKDTTTTTTNLNITRAPPKSCTPQTKLGFARPHTHPRNTKIDFQSRTALVQHALHQLLAIEH